MARLLDELSQLISALNENEIEYAVCGGLASTIHGFPRATFDIDILIKAESLEKAYDVTAKYGYDTRGLDISFKGSAVEIRRVSKIDDDGEVLPLGFLLVNPHVEDVWETRQKLIWGIRNYGLFRLKV